MPNDTTPPGEPAVSPLSEAEILAIRYAGTPCVRCAGWRWPFYPWPEPYLCQRCQEVLAGGNARDPRPVAATPEQAQAWAEAGERLRRFRAAQAPRGAARQTEQPLEQGGVGGAAGPPDDSQAVPPRPTTCYRHRGCFPTNVNRLGCPACIAIASGREPDDAAPDASEAGAPDPAWNKKQAAVKRRDRYRCQRCGAQMPLTVHHIKPREQGGTDDFRNLVTLCVSCHDYVEPDGPASR
jgi:hypothetical protein